MENPEYMLGIPLVALALLGLLAAFSLFAIPAEEPAGGAAAVARHEGDHPSPAEYVIIGIVLAFITAVEVALYYIDLNSNLLIVMLLALSALKFGFVIGWFMHLRFDNKLFTVLFLGGLALAIVLFIVVIATLDAGLV